MLELTSRRLYHTGVYDFILIGITEVSNSLYEPHRGLLKFIRDVKRREMSQLWDFPLSMLVKL